MSIKKISIMLLVVSLSTSLSFSGKEKKAYELIYEDIQLIKQQLNELEKKIEANAQSINQILETVKLLKDQVVTLQTIQADLSQDNELLQAQLQSLSEKLDKTLDQLAKTQEELLALKGGSSGEAGASIQKERKSTSTQPIISPPSESEGSTSFLSPQQIYNTAYSDYLKGNYQLAREGFKQYIEQFRESPLADNAQYWIGECYYSEQDYLQAIDEFNRLILNFPQGDKVPAAYLKKAYAFFALDEKEQGIIVLKLLISKFPESDEAKIAEEKLQEVD